MSNHHPRSENFIFKKELLLSSSGKQTVHESACGPHKGPGTGSSSSPSALGLEAKGRGLCFVPIEGTSIRSWAAQKYLLMVCVNVGEWKDLSPAMCWLGNCGKALPD